MHGCALNTYWTDARAKAYNRFRATDQRLSHALQMKKALNGVNHAPDAFLADARAKAGMD